MHVLILYVPVWLTYLSSKPRLAIPLAMLSRHILFYLCDSSDMKSNWIYRLIHSLHCSLFCLSGSNNILDFNQVLTLRKSPFLQGSGNASLCRNKCVSFGLITLLLPSVEYYLSNAAFRVPESVLSLGLLKSVREVISIRTLNSMPTFC